MKTATKLKFNKNFDFQITLAVNQKDFVQKITR